MTLAHRCGQPVLGHAVWLLGLEKVQQVAPLAVFHDDVEPVLAAVGAPHVRDVGHPAFSTDRERGCDRRKGARWSVAAGSCLPRLRARLDCCGCCCWDGSCVAATAQLGASSHSRLHRLLLLLRRVAVPTAAPPHSPLGVEILEDNGLPGGHLLLLGRHARLFVHLDSNLALRALTPVDHGIPGEAGPEQAHPVNQQFQDC